MKTKILAGVCLATALILSSCASTKTYVDSDLGDWQAQNPPPVSEVSYRVFLVGDYGYAVGSAAQSLLSDQLRRAGKESAVVFLGDNLYCCGLPDSAAAGRVAIEEQYQILLDELRSYPGRVVFLPGERDWNNPKEGGLAARLRQERFVEAYLDRGNVFLPDDGFPGPVDIKLSDGIRLIALDTHWWLTGQDKPFGDTGEFDVDETGDVVLELDDLIRRKRNDHLLVVGHHPVVSNGRHAGRYPAKTHLFPLTEFWKGAYLPLPLVGSLLPAYRRYVGGGDQNLAHQRYRAFRDALTSVLGQHDNIVYAASHDRNLQYFDYREPLHGLRQHHLVSGSISGSEFVGRGRLAGFVSGAEGFMVLDYYKDGSVWMEALAADGSQDGSTLFRKQLEEPSRDVAPAVVAGADQPAPDYSDSTMVLAVNPDYLASATKQFFLGSHHRKAWATPVEVEVFDMSREAGGLTLEKRGGGQQTVSLRFRGADGGSYVLRSLDKDPSKTVPENLQGTVATDIVMDQTASIHPFGAFIIPKLAAAAGVFHTNPKAVYVPHDPRLGEHQEIFSGKLMMFEDRPDDDMSHEPSVGRSDKVISAHKLYMEIDGDNDHRVDQRAFVRARLFDMLLSDWDRHRDQWRWASFEPADGEGKIYRPIPRDRDWAFNRMNGLFPSLASQFDPKFQDFTKSYGYIKGLTSNGLEQDRRFLNALSRETWIEIADSVRSALTDRIIEEAVSVFPAPMYDLNGAEFIHLLKTRRDKLDDAAQTYYEVLARVTDIVGSNKHERFEVSRVSDELTEVVVMKTTKEGEIRKEIYRRQFHRGETKEIRLYGLDGNDQFVITGDVRDGIVVIAVGGQGEDIFVDESNVKGLRRHTRFYDSVTGNTWQTGRETSVRSSDDPGANAYLQSKSFRHNANFPQVFFGSNKDDGFFFGGGMKFVRQGFRKSPYAKSHRIVGNIASKTGAFNIVYNGDFPSALGKWDVGFDASVLSPNNIRNFYGLGNETKNTVDDAEFYRARLSQVTVEPSVSRVVGEDVTFSFTPSLEVTDVERDTTLFNQVQEGISDQAFDTQWYAGAEIGFVVDNVDQAHNPRIGFRWTNTADVNKGIHDSTDDYSRLATDLAMFLSPSFSPQVTLATRVGAAHNVGDFPFYAANALGGSSNLRGWRSTRFAGRTTFYQNAELRAKVFNFSTYLAIGEIGVLGFIDNGRVWTDGESSKSWHQGYGGGVFATMFNSFSLTTTIGTSEDETTFVFKFGFQY